MSRGFETKQDGVRIAYARSVNSVSANALVFSFFPSYFDHDTSTGTY